MRHQGPANGVSVYLLCIVHYRGNLSFVDVTSGVWYAVSAGVTRPKVLNDAKTLYDEATS